jgi:hypothetical protein
MADWRSSIGSVSTRRRIATLVAVVGVAIVANRLATVWPRNVDVAYEVGPGVVELAVDYLQDGEAVCSARFHTQDGKAQRFRHSVKLQPGEYRAQITVYASEGAAREFGRRLSVPANGLVRIDLRGTSEP